jgi:STE24 endopeptidase
MQLPELIAVMALLLIGARLASELFLARLNRRYVLAHADQVPEPFRSLIDNEAYARSVEYTLAKNCFSQFADVYHAASLLLVLFTGVLPWAFQLFHGWLGDSAWAMAAFLFAIGAALALPGLPLDWCEQFRLEQKFGFNTTTAKTWWLDRMKGLLLALLLGYPLLLLMLKFVEWTGDLWWLWAWGALLAFQLVMVVLAPVLILPLFNNFSPIT